jgi:hypothetical protein
MSAVANRFMESSIRDDNRKADARPRKTVKGLLVRVKAYIRRATRSEARLVAKPVWLTYGRDNEEWASK